MALLRYAAIVEFSDDAIAGLNTDGTISSWNKGAERLFGFSANEAIAENILFLAPADAREDGKGVLKRVLEQGDAVKHHDHKKSWRSFGSLADPVGTPDVSSSSMGAGLDTLHYWLC